MNANVFVTCIGWQQQELLQKVQEVLHVERPVSESLLTRRVIPSYSISRSGK